MLNGVATVMMKVSQFNNLNNERSPRDQGSALLLVLILMVVGSVIAIGLFVSIASAIVWFALKATVGVRASEEDEELGLDRAELGMEAYPEFVTSGS